MIKSSSSIRSDNTSSLESRLSLSLSRSLSLFLTIRTYHSLLLAGSLHCILWIADLCKSLLVG